MPTRIRFRQGPVARRLALCCLGALVLAACGHDPSPATAQAARNQAVEQQLRARQLAATGNLTGQVVDALGAPLAGASVSVTGRAVTSDANGRFDITGLAAGSHLLQATHPAHAPLLLPVAIGAAGTHGITLQLPAAGTTRLFFAGDTAFGRRFLDPLLETMGNVVPTDHPDAYIRASSASADAIALTRFVRDFVGAADFSVLNLESPVLANPATPHGTKDYVFFSLPETLSALTAMGIDYVSMGNNHVYDYLEQGVVDTIASMDASGIAWSGMGNNLEAALQSHVATIKGRDYALFSATSVTGNQHATAADPYRLLYVATRTDSPLVKGGAADLTADTLVTAEIQRQALAGHFVIAQLHGGAEYTYLPTPYILSAIDNVTGAGAGLVITHHPHVAQGFAVRNGKPVVLGLGNFLFDQDRQETMIGLAVVVELAGDRVRRLLAYPVYLEDYRPRLLTGDLATRILKRLAEFSDDNVSVIPRDGYAEVFFDAAIAQVASSTLDYTLEVPASGTAIIDLRQIAASDQFLQGVDNVPATTLELGRDLMLHGDFEDQDVDDEVLETRRWDLSSGSVYACLARAHRGLQGVCSERSAVQSSPAVLPYRNTIRLNNYAGAFFNQEIRLADQGYIEENRDIGLYGHALGENAGDFITRVYYTSTADELDYGDEDLLTLAAGTYGWRAFYQPLHLPPASAASDPLLPPAAVRLRLLQQPPAAGHGRLALDDLALVSWDRRLTLAAGGVSGLRPHAAEFLRVQAAPGIYRLQLHFGRLHR